MRVVSPFCRAGLWKPPLQAEHQLNISSLRGPPVEYGVDSGRDCSDPRASDSLGAVGALGAFRGSWAPSELQALCDASGAFRRLK
eukprot:9039847-Alexandrium_andersonii.AAC.1